MHVVYIDRAWDLFHSGHGPCCYSQGCKRVLLEECLKNLVRLFVWFGQHPFENENLIPNIISAVII
jgi:hypothetical protein